ncbi:hypothetical protein GW17_00037110 [Ensete ventricosum]|nr:hypothetical protein GW17_00037110 [Ensete ventricosum]RZS16229.1 hypothetical protein BHM03_00048190 [Ensete ventricosum]
MTFTAGTSGAISKGPETHPRDGRGPLRSRLTSLLGAQRPEETTPPDLLRDHDTELVISDRIANMLVKRVMVDTGSSIDILYKDAFQKLELTTTNLSLISSTRMGRCGETPPRNQRAPDLLRGRRALPSLGSQGTPLPLLGRPSCLSPLARSSIQDSNNDLHGGGAPDCVQHPWAADPQQPKSSCLHLPQHHKVSHWSGSWGNQEQPMGVEVLLPNRGYIAEETESRTSNPRRNYCATLVLGPTASKPSRGSRVAS